MTGPEHYRHAETLLDLASDDDLDSDAERFHITKAQAHATLALAAATALGSIYMDVTKARQLAVGWNDAIGVTP